MASTIKIKRSYQRGAPGSLEYGEIAYSSLPDDGNGNGGDILYIGAKTTSNGSSIVTPIGGKLYVEKLSAVPGTLTASKAIVVDANKKIDELFVNNLTFSTNTISTLTGNNLTLDAATGSKVQFYSGTNFSWTVPRSRGTEGYVLTMGQSGETSWEKVAVELKVDADTSADADTKIDLRNGILTFAGISGITTDFTNDTVTISGIHASYSDVGVASFDSTYFDIDTAAHVTIKNEKIEDIVGDLINTGTKTNIEVTYDDSANSINFKVKTGSATQAGVAQFDSDFFQFSTGVDNEQSKVSLVGSIVQSVTAGVDTVTPVNNAISIQPGSSSGIAVSGSGATITISGVNASANTKGVAKFNQTYFDMSVPGEVKITKASTTGLGLAQFNADNFSVDASGVVTSEHFTIGDVDINLGDNNDGLSDKSVKNLTGLNSIEVGNLKLSGDTLEQTASNTDVILKPKGIVDNRPASFKIDNGTPDSYWILPATRGTANNADNEVLTINKTSGLAEWKAPNQDLTVYGDNSGGQQVLTVGLDSIKFTGATGIATVISESNNRVQVSIEGQVADTQGNVGVAYYEDNTFTVTNSKVDIKQSGITNLMLANKTVGIGTTNVTLGGSQTNFEGLESLSLSKIKIGDTLSASEISQGTISAVGTNKSLYLTGTGGGRVHISGLYGLPNSLGNIGDSLILTAGGLVEWRKPTTVLKFKADTSTDSTDVEGEVDLISGTLYFEGGLGITTRINDAGDTLEIFADKAGYTKDGAGAKGVASFDDAFFYYANLGEITLADNGITNGKLANSTIQIGTNSLSNPAVALGGTITTLSGLSGVTTGNLTVGASSNSSSISSTGDILLSPAAGKKVYIDVTGGDQWSLPATKGAATKVLTSDGAGGSSWETPVTTLNLAGPNSGTGSVSLLLEKLVFANGTGINVTINSNTVTVGGVDADYGTKGVASFSSTDFSVTSGAVSIKSEAIEDIVGFMIGDTTDIEVKYEDNGSGAGKLNFRNPTATTTKLGLAKFNQTDFNIDSSGEVTLEGTVLKAVTVNNGSVNITSNTLVLKGEGTNNNGSGTVVSFDSVTGETIVSVAKASTTTFGVTKYDGDYFTLTNDVVKPKDATYTSKGIASFASSQFTVNAGGVQIQQAQIGNVSLVYGGAITTITGLNSVTVGNLTLTGTSLTSTGNLVLNTGTGSYIDAGGARIRNSIDPVDDTDLATKYYVDGRASGLTVKDPVRVATTIAIDLSDTSGTPPVIDNVTLGSGDRVLVKNQGSVNPNDATATDHAANGIYTWTVTLGAGAWARAADADVGTEFRSGMFMFVQEGDTWGDTGWVLSTDLPSYNLGSDTLKFTQFSSAGVIRLASDGGLKKVGQFISINLDAASGLEINGSNQLELKSTFAGSGLSYSGGILSVGVDGSSIEVYNDEIRIKSTWTGQSSITTVGTIASGTWNGTTISAAYGGTGQSTYTKGDLLVGNASNGLNILGVSGNAGKFLQVNDTGDDVVYGDIDGGEYV